MILSANSNGPYHWKGEGSLSFKFATQGEVHYDIGSHRFRLDGSNFLMLNQSQVYEIEVDKRIPTSTFCVFFGQPLVADVLMSIRKDDEWLLDNLLVANSIEFSKRSHKISDHLLQCGTSIKELLTQKEFALAGEQMRFFLEGLIDNEHSFMLKSGSLNSVKRSTRDEIFKRITQVKEYIHSSPSSDITLEQLAAVACMSPNHLLRSFKQLYGQSPINYLKDVRMDRAKALLQKTTLSIQEICFASGYESLGTFSNTFKNRTGFSPSQYRSGFR